MHPDAAEKVERIVLMGGAYGEGNVTPAAEFNIWCDPEAAERVFRSGLDVTMIGLDVTHRAIFGPEPTAELKAAGRVGAMVAELLEFYGRFHKESYGWDGSPIHDAVAVAHVIDSELLDTERLNVRIETESELCRGRTVVDVWRRTGLEPTANVAVGIDAEGFVRLLQERLARLG
jgi:purine nucleosidase